MSKKRDVVIDPRIKSGMIATIWKSETEKENVFIYQIIYSGKRIKVYSPKTKKITEFSLRNNKRWIKIGEKTKNAITTLAFPELIRRDLLAYFSKF